MMMKMASSTLLLLSCVCALSCIHLSHSYTLKGSVSCLDCNPHQDLSGVKVLLKCGEGHDQAIAATTATGFFSARLPSYPKRPKSCLAELLGGSTQLYAYKKSMVSELVKQTSTPLAFYTGCPVSLKDAKCGSPVGVGSSKTVNLPLPPEWGLAPSSYYIPFIPIIGIP